MQPWIQNTSKVTPFQWQHSWFLQFSTSSSRNWMLLPNNEIPVNSLKTPLATPVEDRHGNIKPDNQHLCGPAGREPAPPSSPRQQERFHRWWEHHMYLKTSQTKANVNTCNCQSHCQQGVGVGGVKDPPVIHHCQLPLLPWIRWTGRNWACVTILLHCYLVAWCQSIL